MKSGIPSGSCSCWRENENELRMNDFFHFHHTDLSPSSPAALQSIGQPQAGCPGGEKGDIGIGSARQAFLVEMDAVVVVAE